MFQLKVQKNIAILTLQEKMTSGSQDVYVVEFLFSDEWAYLERTAVFKSGETIVNVLLDEENRCMIPWEVLVDYGNMISVGVFGTKDGHVVLPTIWAKTDAILEGVTTGDLPKDPTPDVYQQLLARLSQIEEQIATPYTFGHGFKQEGMELSVDAVSNFEGDNTLPMTAAGVQHTVGNIELLLRTI